jgi:hypothetical protein
MRIRPAATTIALLALLAGLMAATASPAAAATPCWKRVINQWLNNQPINTHYKPQCYQQALKHVPEDLRDYSDITDAISIALQNALRGDKSGGASGGGGTQSSGGTSSNGNGTSNADSKPRRLQSVPDRSYYRRAIDNLGTTSADSLPIPLLVLAGLGTALLLSAAGLAAHKRLKARPRPPTA